ncbi:hypothetical protein HanXRQr2_Chr17g0820471 [Helianthus annuus]|uniref:Uncharacterized protein n=1 Tax=Helianthus annuus TaxID=4232 RepID=A0A9K3DME1_HELAN|nr:hypothetical protein HanXRQr2_Chr17g0820471 [Helianthus annuus]
MFYPSQSPLSNTQHPHHQTPTFTPDSLVSPATSRCRHNSGNRPPFSDATTLSLRLSRTPTRPFLPLTDERPPRPPSGGGVKTRQRETSRRRFDDDY